MRLANYNGDDLAALCVREDQTIQDAMRIMSNAGLRLVPVVAAQGGDFVGVIADGDIRRYLSENDDVHIPTSEVVNRSPVKIETDISVVDARAMMIRHGVEYMPLVRNNKIEALFVLWVASDSKSLTAVIMAGGLGKRLAPLTDDCPKPMLELGGKPILSHIIEGLRDQGVTRFVLSTNYLSEMIVNHFGDGAQLGVSISYVHEQKRLGTGGALSLVDVEELSEPFLCLNGDILNDIDVDGLRLQHQSNNWDATMVVRNFNYTVPYGLVKTSPEGDFVEAQEKPTIQFKINAGYYMLSKSVLRKVPEGKFYDLPTLFTDLQQSDMHGGTFVHEGRWIDIGDIAELSRARAIFEGKTS
ncbi:nucleotidyltransferase family protein [Thalassobius sp. I31.1]|uniref:nucleotidyltransferase family protein n=1 Tax=Thalassobius sp. I31.1 TaxID=2109912 RepID=UPI000D1A5091|nr:nucleotidyltransferase family protein [Thalassobius sp. I31.1]